MKATDLHHTEYSVICRRDTVNRQRAMFQEAKSQMAYANRIDKKDTVFKRRMQSIAMTYHNKVRGLLKESTASLKEALEAFDVYKAERDSLEAPFDIMAELERFAA